MPADLLDLAKNGSRKAFTELMTAEIPMLRGFVRLKLPSSYDTEDVMQEIMLAVWLKIKDCGSESFKGWLLGIARHKIADYYRSAYNSATVSLDDADDADTALNDGGESEQSDTETDISDAMRALNAEERELVYMIFNAGMTYPEISELTGIPTGTVKSRMSSIKAKLRPKLENYRS